MELTITTAEQDYIGDETQRRFDNVIQAEVQWYLHHSFVYTSDKYPYKAYGDKALDQALRETIRQEVQFSIRERIDQIVKKSISQATQSILKNPHYDELKAIIIETMGKEQEHECE